MNALGRHRPINTRVSSVHGPSKHWLYKLCSNHHSGMSPVPMEEEALTASTKKKKKDRMSCSPA